MATNIDKALFQQPLGIEELAQEESPLEIEIDAGCGSREADGVEDEECCGGGAGDGGGDDRFR